LSGSRFDTNQTSIPLFFIRMRGGAPTTGLTVLVSVVNAITGASLLSSTSAPETSAGSGLYSLAWVHGITQTTEAIATYSVTVGGVTKLYKEHFTISSSVDVIESDLGRAT
jgi:hypothetical protein